MGKSGEEAGKVLSCCISLVCSTNRIGLHLQDPGGFWRIRIQLGEGRNSRFIGYATACNFFDPSPLDSGFIFLGAPSCGFSVQDN